MRLLGLDVGDKTIGLAASDELGYTAQGLPTVRRQQEQRDLDAVFAVVKERGTERAVVGWPLNMDGSEGPRARLCRAFATKLVARGLETRLWDERLTSRAAERALIEGGARREKRRQVIDQLAAQLILQGYMDAGCPEGELP